ncbi:hypothetical protein pb186bvf_005713 [Paramecium bursaria]
MQDQLLFQTVFFREKRKLAKGTRHPLLTRQSVLVDSIKNSNNLLNQQLKEKHNSIFIPFVFERDSQGKLLKPLNRFLEPLSHRAQPKKKLSDTQIRYNIEDSRFFQLENFTINEILFIIKMTEQQLITQIFTAQCHQDFDESTTQLRELFALLTNRIKEFKQHPKFGKVLQENFEILPQSNLISLVQCTPDEDQNRYQKYLQSYCCQSEEETIQCSFEAASTKELETNSLNSQNQISTIMQIVL